MSEQVVNEEKDAQVINVKDIKEEVVNEDVQADYIIPIKRKIGVNDDDDNVIKRQRSILNAYNSPEKEEISEIQFIDDGWNCGGYKLTLKSVMIFDRLKTFEERYAVENDPIVITDDAGMLHELSYKTSKKQKDDIIYAIDEERKVGTIDDYNAKYFNYMSDPYRYVEQSDYKLWPVIRDFATDYPLLFRNDPARDKYIAYTNEGVHILSQTMIEDIERYKKLVSIWKLFARVKESDGVTYFHLKLIRYYACLYKLSDREERALSSLYLAIQESRYHSHVKFRLFRNSQGKFIWHGYTFYEGVSSPHVGDNKELAINKCMWNQKMFSFPDVEMTLDVVKRRMKEKVYHCFYKEFTSDLHLKSNTVSTSCSCEMCLFNLRKISLEEREEKEGNTKMNYNIEYFASKGTCIICGEHPACIQAIHKKVNPHSDIPFSHVLYCVDCIKETPMQTCLLCTQPVEKYVKVKKRDYARNIYVNGVVCAVVKMCKDDHIGYHIQEAKNEQKLKLITEIVEGGDYKTQYYWTDRRTNRI